MQMMMKYISALVFLLLLGTGSAPAQKAETIEIRTQIYCDHCMQCESCGNRIQNAVYAGKGIRTVKVRAEENIIEVSYNPKKTTADDIRRAITAVGFSADDQKPSATAYSNLDACCKRR